MRFDPFIVAILAALVLGLVLPVNTEALGVLSTASDVAIWLLFLVYGLRLATTEVINGLRNWRVQGLIFASTYIAFPLIGLLAHWALEPVLGAPFAQGLLYLSLLPSTVQSSVTFTSIARGDVAGAVCAATLSNVIGMFLTPLYVLLFMNVAGASAGSFGKVLYLLLLPFIIGQLLQPKFGAWIRSKRAWTKLLDQGTVVLVVLSAVAEATHSGVWGSVTVWQILALTLVSTVILAIALAGTWYAAKGAGCTREGAIAVLMCGSKKSLATGLPMAKALFPAAAVGPIAVPVIIFHQIQLVVCAIIAQRLGREVVDQA